MPSRRIKSIMHGSAEDTRVFHREHRSKNGRVWHRKHEQRMWRQRFKEKGKEDVMDNEIDKIIKKFNIN